MAKTKEFNSGVVEAEFNKISLPEQFEQFHKLGEWIHQKLQDAETSVVEMKKKMSSNPK